MCAPNIFQASLAFCAVFQTAKFAACPSKLEEYLKKIPHLAIHLSLGHFLFLHTKHQDFIIDQEFQLEVQILQ